MNIRVRAIIIDTEQRVLLIHRIKTKENYYVFPGGGVENDDTDPRAALMRECQEELGVQVSVNSLLTEETYQKGDEKQQELFYHCRITGGKLGTGQGEEFSQPQSGSGLYEIVWVPLANICELDLRPQRIAQMLLQEKTDGYDIAKRS